MDKGCASSRLCVVLTIGLSRVFFGGAKLTVAAELVRDAGHSRGPGGLRLVGRFPVGRLQARRWQQSLLMLWLQAGEMLIVRLEFLLVASLALTYDASLLNHVVRRCEKAAQSLRSPPTAIKLAAPTVPALN